MKKILNKLAKIMNRIAESEFVKNFSYLNYYISHDGMVCFMPCQLLP